MFFDENGMLNIDEMVEKNASFQHIMADGVVTAEELKAQAESEKFCIHCGEKNADSAVECKSATKLFSIYFV